MERYRMLDDYRKPARASSIRKDLSSAAVARLLRNSRSSCGTGAVSVMDLPGGVV